MALKDLAYTADEIEKNKPKCCEVSQEYEGPKYPWGLSLHLENEVLTKLGLDVGKFKVGQKVPMTVLATVTSISMNETEHGKTQCLTLICGQIEMKTAKSNDEMAEELYGEKKS